MIKIYIPLRPVAKGRPRFGKNNHVYTPDKTKNYESSVGLLVKNAIQNAQSKIEIDKPLTVDLTFSFKPPESWVNSKRLEATSGLTKHITVPDLDNLIKAVLDALNGIAYNDDKQIVELKAKKIYAAEDSVNITIEYL